MASFNGRRAPNVSQHISNLNTIPSAADMAQQQQDFTSFDDDLALFTNTQFFDFDMGESATDVPASMNFDVQAPQQKPQQQQQPDAAKPINYIEPQFNYNQFGPFPAPQGPMSTTTSPPNGIPFASGGQQSQPTLPQAHHFAATPLTGDKRSAATAQLPLTQDLEEGSRHAAEEDKRRRNTAASARFRVKKKQREQALEKSAKEMSDKVATLEARVGQLEMENKWLKGLITERNGGVEVPVFEPPPTMKDDGGEDVMGKGVDVKAVEEYDVSDEEEDVEDEESSTGLKKRGVGTSA